MKAKNLIPFIVILVVLAVAAYWLKGGQTTPSIIEQTRLEALAPEEINAKQVARLELYAGPIPDEKVILERDGDAWRAASHYNAPVNTDTVNEFLEKVVKVKGEFRTTAEGERLDPYSLGDDQAFHVLAYKSGASDPAIHVLVGKAPNFRTVFMRQAGDNRVFVEAVNLRQDAGLYGDDFDRAPTPDKWLNKDVLKLDKEKINKIALTMPDKKLLFEKREKPRPEQETDETGDEDDAQQPEPPVEYEWALASGGPGSAHKESGLNSLLQRFSALMANTVVDPEKKAEWGLDPAAFKAAVTLDDGEEVVLEGGRPDPAGSGYVRVASADQDIVYELSKFTFEQVFPKGADLFDLPALSLDREKIERIEISRPEGRIVVGKDGHDWTVTEPGLDLNPQRTTLSSLASGVAAWRPGDYADSGATMGDFNTTVIISGEDISHTIALSGDAKSIDGVYARLDDAEMTLVMNRTDANRILLRPRDLFELKLLDFNEDDVTAIDIRDGDAAFSLARDGEKWTLTAEGGVFDAEDDKCEEFLFKVSEFQVDDILADVDPASWQAYSSITLALKEGEPLRCTFSEEQDGVYYMSAPGKPYTFTLTETAMIELRDDFAALRTPKLPPEIPAIEEAPVTIEPLIDEAIQDAETPSDEAAEASVEFEPVILPDSPAEDNDSEDEATDADAPEEQSSATEESAESAA